MADHAKYSPSGAEKWSNCPGSLVMEQDIPNTSSMYADEGTTAHELSELALRSDHKQTSAFVGQTCAKTGMKFTADMAEHTQKYVNDVLEYAVGNDLFIEQRVDFSEVIGQEDAFGTSDAIILTRFDDEIQAQDLKYGMGIQVYAEKNKQLLLYASGARQRYGYLGNFKRVRVVIHQPRLNHISEWSCTAEELDVFEEQMRKAAAKCALAEESLEFMDPTEWSIEFLRPGEKQCRWCRAAPTCPALANYVVRTVGDEFDNIDDIPGFEKTLKNTGNTIPHLTPKKLGELMSVSSMIEGWIKAIRSRVETLLLEGNEVPGYKLVEGKLGNRNWSDAEAAEEAIKKFRLKKEEMYNYKLISPTDAEKLLKKTPKRWKSLQPLITRTPGQPHVAPESDKRPAFVINKIDEDDFDDII